MAANNKDGGNGNGMSEKDMSNQLQLTQKLIAATEQLSRAVEKLSGALGDQSSTVSELNKALDEMVNKDVGKLNNTKLDNLSQQLKNSSKNAKDLDKSLNEIAADMSKKVPKSAIVATVAMNAFNKALQGYAAVGRSVIGLTGSLVKGFTNVGMALVSIPFSVMKAVIALTNENMDGMNEYQQALEDLRKEFGELGKQTKGPTANAVLATTQSLQGVTIQGLSAYRVFGNMAAQLKAVTQLASEMGPTFNKLQGEFESNGGALMYFQKGLGLTGEQMAAFGNRAIATGTSLSKTLIQTTQISKGLGKAFGLDAKLISKDIGKAAADVKHFGSVSIKAIGEAATYARKLGLELSGITGTLDAFETFDSAADNASKLAQSFGMNVDVMKMMNAQDPAEVLDHLRKSFFAAGQSSESFSRQQLKLLAQTVNLSEEQAKLAFSSKNQGVSLDDIKKKSEESTKKTMTQQEALMSLKDSIDRIVQSMEKFETFFDAFIGGFKRGIMMSPELRKLMQTTLSSLQQIFWMGVELSKTFLGMRGVRDVLEGITKTIASIPKLFGSISNSIKEFASGKLSMFGFFAQISKDITMWLTGNTDPGKMIMIGLGKLLKGAANLSGELIKALGTGLTTAINWLTEFISNPSSIDGGGAKNFITNLIKPIVAAVTDKQMWKDLWVAIKGLAKAIYNELSIAVSKVPTSVWVGMAAALFGAPAIAVLTSAAVSALGVVFSGLAAIAGAVLAPLAAGLASAIGAVLFSPVALGLAATAAIGAAAVGGKEGIKKYKDQIGTELGSDLDRSIGAGLAGIVQMLSFGFLSDEGALDLAKNFTNYSNAIMSTLKNVFGDDFINDITDVISDALSVAANFTEMISALFSGDFKGFSQKFGELIGNALSLAISYTKRKFLALPTLVLEWVSSIMDVLKGWADKFFTKEMAQLIVDKSEILIKKTVEAIKTFFTNAYDSFISIVENKIIPAVKDIPDRLIRLVLSFGTALAKLVTGVPSMIFKAIAFLGDITSMAFKKIFGESNFVSVWVIDPVVSGFRTLADFLGEAGKWLTDKIDFVRNIFKKKEEGAATGQVNLVPLPDPKKVEAEIKTNAETTAKAVIDANANMIQKVTDANQKVVEKSADKIDPMQLLSQTSVSTESLANIKKSMANISESDLTDIRKKYDSIISTFSGQSGTNFEASMKKLQDVEAIIHGIESVERSAAIVADVLKKSKIAAVTNVANAIDQMIVSINAIDEQLNKMPTIDMTAKLEAIAKGVGVNKSYQIKNREIVINMNLTVEMNAADMEKALILREKSVIRDRLNTSLENRTDKTIHQIPSTISSPLKVPAKGGT